MDSTTTKLQNTRIGLHYFPDTQHYRDIDLQTWLPQIEYLGAQWLTLIAPNEWVIPESFLQKLISAGIEPILHFQFSLVNPPQSADLEILFNSYARRGVKYAVLFDRPNSRSSWSVATWTQEDLVERFLDRFIPCAEAVIQAGLIPVFPPLEPGGNYWDTSFLKTALISLQRRSKTELLEKLVLSAYAWTGEHSLNWGAGGPQRWAGARPYFTPDTEEDQRGFRVFDWYLSISESALGQRLPIILFGLTSPIDPKTADNEQEIPASHAQEAQIIARMLAGETVSNSGLVEGDLEPIDEEVLAGNFWLLSTDDDSPLQPYAWFRANGEKMPAATQIHMWFDKKKTTSKTPWKKSNLDIHPIRHYLLLPLFDWGVADWHLDIIRPFVKKFQPTIGFSIEEAEYAEKVTVIGGEDQFPEEALTHLRNIGCVVDRIEGNGTQIASILAER